MYIRFVSLTHGKSIKMKEGYWKEDDSLLFVLMYVVRYKSIHVRSNSGSISCTE